MKGSIIEFESEGIRFTQLILGTIIDEISIESENKVSIDGYLVSEIERVPLRSFIKEKKFDCKGDIHVVNPKKIKKIYDKN